MTTLVPSVLDGSSSFLQVTRLTIKARMRVNLGKIPSLTSEQIELSYISSVKYNKVNGWGIPCGRNSSYTFISILLKPHWCLGQGLKICMWFEYKPQIIFCHFFRKLNLAIFWALYITK